MSKKKEQSESKKYNAKRSGKIAYLCKKNYEMSKQIKSYMLQNELPERNEKFLLKLDKNISSCAFHSLYRVGEHYNTSYIASHTCDNRNCNVCNWQRQKKIRRTYLKFFENNQFLFQIVNKKSSKLQTVTENTYHTNFKNNEKYYLSGKVEYDLMHLTLTLPHYSETGFRGKKFYYSEIIRLFNEMRKSKRKVQLTEFLKASFSDFVFGGEYGVETTKTDNGLNIHIHSLVFIKKYKKSRNLTHKLILTLWNNITVNEFSKRKEFSKIHIEKILKGNKFLTEDYIRKELNPQGSTMIGLETIYTKKNNIKIRDNKFLSDNMIKAVMETISYHFEPQAFEKKHNEFDMDLLAELLPEIYNQRLYARFGCLYRESTLAFKHKDITTEYDEVKSDVETGEIEFAEHYIIRPYRIFHDKNNDEEIKVSEKLLKKSIKIDAISTQKALSVMNDMYVKLKQNGQ